MGFNFPSSPALDQVFGNYKWNGYAWMPQGSGGGGGVTASGVTFAPAGNVAASDVQAAIQELDTEKVAKAGDTMSGDLTIQKDSPTLILNSPGAAANNQILGYRASALRWKTQFGNVQSETGADAGSDFEITRYSDGGSLNSALYIKRSAGHVGIGTATPNYHGVASPYRVLTVLGTAGFLELATAGADADGLIIGGIAFASSTLAQANRQTAQIRSEASGATAGNRGGKLAFYTKNDNGGLVQALELRANQFALFASGIGVSGGIVYFNSAFTQYLNFNGSQFSMTGNLILGGGVLYLSDTSHYIQWQGTWEVHNQGIYVGGNGYYTGNLQLGSYFATASYGQFNTGNGFIGTPLSIGAGVSWSSSGIGLRFHNTSSWTGMTIQDNVAGGNGIYIMFMRDDGAQLGYISGTVTGINYANASDRRHKDNITPVMSMPGFDIKSRIMGVEVVSFTAKDYPDSPTQIGVIAQQAYEHMPEMVIPPPAERPKALAEDAPDPVWMVDHTAAVPQLIAGMQAMWREIDALKAGL